MTEAIPNLWPRKFSRGILTPLAVLRVQAAKFKEMTDGLLEAEVTSETNQLEDGGTYSVHTLELIARPLDSYRRTILSAQHDQPGAYPVTLFSDFVGGYSDDWVQYEDNEPASTCGSQEELFKRLSDVFGSNSLTTLIESLIAQINDAEAVPA